jgi:hypothetical protein
MKTSNKTKKTSGSPMKTGTKSVPTAHSQPIRTADNITKRDARHSAAKSYKKTY